jgi:hypothetical protein
MNWAAAGTDFGRPSVVRSLRERISTANSHGSGNSMRRLALWAGMPATVVAGVALWFILVPGRSGAG